MMKALIKKTPLYTLLRYWRGMKEIKKWQSLGCPIPPPHIVKQLAIKKYSKQYGLKVLVETGTYYGEMIEAMKYSFEKIYSVELSEALYHRAKERFKNNAKVELVFGDSGKVLGNIMKEITRPTLFWLDGHYSGGVTARGETDTPIYAELKQIFGASDLAHVILIDDARFFGSDPGYPDMEALSEFVHANKDNIEITVKDDYICLLPVN